MAKDTAAEKHVPRWTRRDDLRDPAIVELAGIRIGPAFPREEGHQATGMRGVPRRKTLSPITDGDRARRRRAQRAARASRAKNR